MVNLVDMRVKSFLLDPGANLCIMVGMNTVEQLRQDLNRRRGDWIRIAASTGLSYWTILRIANGRATNPKIDTVEALQKALKPQ